MKASMKIAVFLGLSAAAGGILALAVAPAAATRSPTPTAGPPIVVPAVANMSALARSATGRDKAVAAAAEPAVEALTDPAGAPPGMAPGTPDMQRLRVLLDDVGLGHRSIYAVPTSGGRVCGGLTGGPSGCLEGFTARSPVDFFVGDADGIGTGDPAIVWGLAPDNVRAVHVVVAGVKYAAVMGKDAYFFEFPSASLTPSAVTAIAVDFSNGGSQVIDVGVGVVTASGR